LRVKTHYYPIRNDNTNGLGGEVMGQIRTKIDTFKAPNLQVRVKINSTGDVEESKILNLPKKNDQVHTFSKLNSYDSFVDTFITTMWAFIDRVTQTNKLNE
jgi:hypothetical protein